MMAGMLPLVICFCAVGLSECFLMVHNVPRKVVAVLTVTNGGPFGNWHAPHFCAAGAYATGFNMKIEDYQHGSDDTELNGILLRCEGLDGSAYGGDVGSYEGEWGEWKGLTSCDSDDQQGLHHFLTAFAMQVESYQHGGDDTEANYVKFKCRDFTTTDNPYEITKPGHGDFGNYGDWSASCPANSAICGISTRVENHQGSKDDTALNDAKMYCCSE